MEAAFGAGPPYTVGVAEECAPLGPAGARARPARAPGRVAAGSPLVAPAARARGPAVGAVMEAGDGAGLVTSELSRSCVEMVSPVFETVADLARELPALRRQVAEMARGAGVEIVAAGTHPFSEPTEQPLAEGAHNRRLEDEMGWVARTQAIYRLHAQAAAPERAAAIGAVNELA